MAAAVRVCCALRITVGGVAPLRTVVGAAQVSRASAVSLQRNPALPPVPATAWQQTRQGSFFNKCQGGFLWPGLNTPVVKDKVLQIISQRSQANQQKVQAELVRQREEWDRRRKMKVKRERGWTGNSWETYEDFDSRVIEVKSVFNMTAKEGRKRSISALVAVGNGNGAAGFALGKAADRNTALRKAKNRAIHYLYYIDRYNDHTSYGLHCHRAVITLCKLIGIKDMYCKVEGSINYLNITRALFTGLANQNSHQSLADKKKLHVVEFQSERGPLPMVVASPKDGARPNPEREDEILNTRLHWDDVRAVQGTKRSIWAGVKRTI
ncbi:hypothetical protein INR49_007665, partial [Caranx melampygus]